MEVGADLYMTKPFDPDALLAKARSVLGLSATPDREPDGRT
jgi:two-component system alkaline phosphatase synthesis response regulator PhoP